MLVLAVYFIVMLERLYKHQDTLIEIAKLFDKNLAEDIVQETYIKLHQYSTEEKCFIGEKLNKSYLFIVIRSVYITSFYNKFITVDLVDNIVENAFDINDEIEWYKFRTKCEAEVNSWDVYDKKLFTIYRDSDLSIRKLAKETGISFVSIFHSLKSHKKKLRELFQEDYDNLNL